MSAFFRIGLIVTGVFSIASIISFMFVYPAADRFAYNSVGQDLLQAKHMVHEAFDNTSPSEWHGLSIKVSEQIDMAVYIDKFSDNYIPEQYIEQFKNKLGNTGIIEQETLQIYYPLDDEFVLTVGPALSSQWASYFSELVTWFIALLVSLTLAYFFFRHHQQELTKLAALLPTQENNQSKTIDFSMLTQRINALVLSGSNKSDSLEKLIISQRDLLHGIAHEVRSPLARMEFAIELLQTADEQQQAELSQQLDSYLKEIDELVRSLLRYSRLQHDESEISLSMVPVNELAEIAVDKVSNVYPAITFNIIGKASISIDCDIQLLTIALANILRNAGRFARSNCVVDWIEKDEYLLIIIEDDGAGLPPGKAQQIFEPFTRLDPSRARDSGGHGLGLAIVQAIVHRHGGRVDVSDADIGGAKFTLMLPKYLKE